MQTPKIVFKSRMNIAQLVFIVSCLLLNSAVVLSQPFVDNCTANEFSIPITASNWRMIFIFNCLPTTPFNPPFPDFFLSQATKYNELDLSPNFFTQLPISSLCEFKYTTSLDMSHNYLSSLRNAFVDLRCLSALSHVDMSNNLIATPIMASDFDDDLAAQIGSLNLTRNLIPAVESRAFLRLDGTSRFPELTYLGLAHNRIKDFDPLWPLTLPSPILTVDLKVNPIARLVNQFGFGYSNSLFRHNMTGHRRVDVTTNSLQYLDDSNMLQFGLFNANDMRDFLFKLSNYDFRQSNRVRTFICYCPTYGLLTVTWYREIANQLDISLPIFQLYCKEYPYLVYVFDFPCNDSRTSDSSSSTTTTVSVLDEEDGSSSSSFMKNHEIKEEKLREETPISLFKPAYSYANLYYLLSLLLIPIVLVAVFLFICCCGRCCQVNTSHMCNFLVCPCMRPNDKSQFTGKPYDITILYNRFDETWVDEELLSEIMTHERRYHVQKLSLSGRPASEKLSRDVDRILRSCKRVVLVFSLDFVEDEFKNRSLLSTLKELAQQDADCVLVAINKSSKNDSGGGLDARLFDYCVDYLDSPTRPDNRSFERSGYYEKMSTCARLAARVKFHCGLRDVERLNFNDENFSKHFAYTLPMIDADESKPSSSSSSKTKKGNGKQLEYANENKDARKLRHIVIPIPEFMKTKLGGFRSAATASRRIKSSNKTHHRDDNSIDRHHHSHNYSVNNDDEYDNDSDYYSSRQHQQQQKQRAAVNNQPHQYHQSRVSSSSTRGTNTTTVGGGGGGGGMTNVANVPPPYQQQDKDAAAAVMMDATNAYLNRHTGTSSSHRPTATTTTTATAVKSASMAYYRETIESSSRAGAGAPVNRNLQKRCETPDILALFAPRPDKVIELSGASRSSSRTGANTDPATAAATVTASVSLAAANKRRSSSFQQQQQQAQQRTPSNSNKKLSLNDSVDNDID